MWTGVRSVIGPRINPGAMIMQDDEKSVVDRRTFNSARFAILTAIGGVALAYCAGVGIWIALGFKLS